MGSRSVFERRAGASAEAPPELQNLTGIPFVTLGLIALLVLVFACEQRFGVEPGASLTDRSLDAFGAARADLVFGQGQWWRVPASILLHGNALHLLGNSLALLIAGLMLERRIGGAWFAALFVLGGVVGALFSLASGSEAAGSIGASGAIMALLVPALMEAFGGQRPQMLRSMRWWVLAIVVASLVPIEAHTDYAGHIGGGLVGAILGFALLFAFPKLCGARSGRWAAMTIVLAGAACALVAADRVAVNYRAELYGPTLSPSTPNARVRTRS